MDISEIVFIHTFYGLQPRQTFLARRYLEMAKKLAIKQIERLEYG